MQSRQGRQVLRTKPSKWAAWASIAMVALFVLLLVLAFATPARGEGIEVVEPLKESSSVLDISFGAALDFNWFGSRASDNPYANVTWTFDTLVEGETSGWELNVLENQHVGTHKEGSLVDYTDIIAGHVRLFQNGRYKLWSGIELFYGPGQYGAEWLLFTAPLVKFTYTPSAAWDVTSIVQLVGAHHLDYTGDKAFLVEEFTLHPVRGERLKLDITLAGVFGETSRRTFYGGPKFTIQLRDSVGFWFRAFVIRTWTADGEVIKLAPRPVIGMKFSW